MKKTLSVSCNVFLWYPSKFSCACLKNFQLDFSYKIQQSNNLKVLDHDHTQTNSDYYETALFFVMRIILRRYA